MNRQARLIRGTPAELARFIAAIELDDGVREVVEVCRAAKVAYAIASDGYDVVIEGVLKRLRLDCPIASNHLVSLGEDRWQLFSPHSQPACRSRAGTCKCALADAAGVIVIGDGKSDFCVAERADHVFAKGRLAQHCRERGIHHTEFSSLREVLEPLAAMLRRVNSAVPAITE